MELIKGRPLITGEDHPRSVYSALLSSIVFYNQQMPEEAFAWVKTAQDAYEAVQDGFVIIDAASEPLKPDGEALLFVSLDQLELALVSYGCEYLQAPESPHGSQEVAAVDTLLRSIDSLR